MPHIARSAVPWRLLAVSALVFLAVWLAPPSHALEGLSAYLPLHSFIETLSIVVAAMVFGVAWNAYSEARSGNLLIVGCGLLATALIDFAHMLSFLGMPDVVTPSSPEKAINFWLAARLVAALALLAAALRRPVPFRWRGAPLALLGAALAVAATVYWIGLYHADLLPRTFVPGRGLTAVKIAAEYFIVGLLAAAAWAYYARLRRSARHDDAMLFCACALSMLSELAFTLYSGVTDIFNLLGHLYKVLAYGFVYFGLFVTSVREPFERVLASESRARALAVIVESTDDAVVSATPDKLVTTWNAGAERLYGYRAAEMLGQPVTLLLTPERAAQERKILESALAGHRIAHYETECRTKDARTVAVSQTVSPILDYAGRVVGMAAIARDIGERKAQERKIERLDRIRSVLSAINSTIVRVRRQQELFDETCRIAVHHGRFAMAWVGLFEPGRREPTPAACVGPAEAASPPFSACRVEERSVSELLAGKRPVLCDDSNPRLWEPCAAQGRTFGFRSRALLPVVVAGELAAVIALYSREVGLFDQEEVALLGELAADVAFALDHIAKEEQVSYLALYDPLTGLANRTLFFERLAQQLPHSGSPGAAAVALIDLERFQNINDTLGWHGGDAVLKSVATRLIAALPGVNVARVDADAYAVALPGLRDAADAMHIMRRALARCFSKPFEHPGGECRISAQCGIAAFPADGGDAATLYRNAGAALKRAKATGEPLLFYAPAMNDRIADRVRLESRLHRSLEQRHFRLHYQPKVDSKGGTIAGLEALIRWDDPEGHLQYPAQFLPVLEETGLMLAVGRWALEEAVRQRRAWQAMGLRPPRIAVNVSAIQLRQTDFAHLVQEVIGTTGSDHGLDLEVPESVIMKDVEENIAKLKALRDRGVGVAIDDFGTGYSSLSHIAKLPVDALKIDGSFIARMAKDADDMAIVATIISLGHQLNLKVIAEGVDDAEQAKLLRLLKCDQMQGHLFGKPLAAEEAAVLLRASSEQAASALRQPTGR